jgi:hypothetical protein
VEYAHEVWAFPFPTALPVPRSPQISKAVPKPATKWRAHKVALEARNILRLTAAGLGPELAALIAGIHLDYSD